MPKTKRTISVELTPAALATLKELADARGMKQKALIERLLEWFAQQPDDGQGVILGHVSEALARYELVHPPPSAGGRRASGAA